MYYLLSWSIYLILLIVNAQSLWFSYYSFAKSYVLLNYRSLSVLDIRFHNFFISTVGALSRRVTGDNRPSHPLIGLIVPNSSKPFNTDLT